MTITQSMAAKFNAVVPPSQARRVEPTSTAVQLSKREGTHKFGNHAFFCAGNQRLF
jgi:hypothetical protein